MAILTPSPRQQFIDENGDPLASGKVHTYVAGTTTPLATYTNAAGSASNTNPIILDSSGRANIWLTSGASYKFVVNDADDVLVYSQDDISAPISSATLAASGGATLIGYLFAASGAILRTVADWLNDRVSVFNFMTVAQIADVRTRSGSLDVSGPLQTAINYATTVGRKVYFPSGKYNIATTTLVLKNNAIYYGEGRDATGLTGTLIYYTGTSDAVQLNNPINSSTAANVTLRDLSIKCSVVTSGKGCFADTGSTYLNIENCHFVGNDRLVILDQSELANIRGCEFELGAVSAAGIWLVNGPTRSGGASLLYTNRINIEQNNQFNGTVGVGIADDGGASHRIVGNNLNDMAKHIRATWVYGLTIDGNESEGASSTHFDFAISRLDGGGATDPCSQVTISNNFFSSVLAIPLFTLANTSIQHLTHYNNHCNCANVGGSIFSNLSAGATACVGWNTVQFGTGSVVNGTTVNAAGTMAVPTWTSASNPQPSLGNGTLDVKWIRNGTSVTVMHKLVIGGTTSLGTGEWSFGTPFTAASSALPAIGSVQGVSGGGVAWAVGASRIDPGATFVQCFDNGGAAAFGPITPAVWASTDYLLITTTYQADPNWLP